MAKLLQRQKIGFYCTVKNCDAKPDGRSSFFYFPKDPVRRINWLQKSGRAPELLQKDNKWIDKLRVCGKHFEKKYLNHLQNRLLAKAVPTLHLPDNTEENRSSPKSEETIIIEHMDVDEPPCSIEQISDPLSLRSDVEIIVIQTEKSHVSTQTQASLTGKSVRERKLQLEIRKLRARNKRLQLASKKHLENITIDDFKLLCGKFLPPSYAKFVQQVVNLNTLVDKGRRYTEEYKRFAQQLYCISPKAYKFLQKTIALPSVKSLQRFKKKVTSVGTIEHLDILRKMVLPQTRTDPVILKLDTPEFKSLFTEELNKLHSIFSENGYEIRIAGGAVRDLLMGKQPVDLDFATTATPTEMKKIFTDLNIRMINLNGEKHGTITPRINDKVNYEVTTLRIDVTTDGRHAEVQFTTDWLLDANRRDLTINSMFLDLDGNVYDYFYGHEDLQNRRIAFVGDAKGRIQEDYLRILRYFRFYGRIAKEPNAHETTTLEVIKENAEGLQNISGERIWTELKKILEGNYAGEIMVTMLENNIGPYIGLPANCNIDELKKVWNRSKHLKMHAITLLASLLNYDEAVLLHARLKLSAFERDLALFIVEHRDPKPHAKPLMPYQQLVLKSKNKKSDNDTRQWVIEVLKYNNSPYLKEFEEWQAPKFPISGAMLKEKQVEGGRFFGLVMKELQDYWADNDFNLSAEDILKQLPHVISDLEERKKSKK